MPAIVKRLTSSAKESKNILKESVYFTNHKYKMQCTILSGLGYLVLNMHLSEKYLYDVCNAVAHYLAKDQPLELQVVYLYIKSIIDNVKYCLLTRKILKSFTNNCT